jgi:hypothetical protein
MSLEENEICRIIKLCAKLGVTHFRAEGVELDFRSDNTPQENLSKTRDNPKKREEIEQLSLLRSEVDLKQEQLDNLLLEDPQAYEELETAGEVEDGRTNA